MSSRHEKLFMWVVSAWGIFRMLWRHPRVIVYGNDMIGNLQHEPRMAKIYEWLERKGVSYINLIHAAPHGKVVQHWRRRKQPVVYLEVLNYSSVLLSWFMRLSRAQQLWGIDDFRYWPKVVRGARRANIRSVLFQHGRFNRHRSGVEFPDSRFEEELPDLYIVWNDYWREKLLTLSKPFAQKSERVRVGGKPSYDQTTVVRENSASDLQVLVIHEPAASSSEIQHVVKRLNEVKNLKRTYKVRKDQAVSRQIEHHGLQNLLHNHWTVSVDVPSVDLVIGSYSTLLYEMVQAKVPVGVLKVSSMQADDLVEDRLASLVDPYAADFEGELIKAARIHESELNRRAERLAINYHIEDTLAGLLNT